MEGGKVEDSLWLSDAISVERDLLDLKAGSSKNDTVSPHPFWSRTSLVREKLTLAVLMPSIGRLVGS